MTIQYPTSIFDKNQVLLFDATSDKEIMSIEEYYVNKFYESEYSDN